MVYSNQGNEPEVVNASSCSQLFNSSASDWRKISMSPTTSNFLLNDLSNAAETLSPISVFPSMDDFEVLILPKMTTSLTPMTANTTENCVLVTEMRVIDP